VDHEIAEEHATPLRAGLLEAKTHAGFVIIQPYDTKVADIECRVIG
jgi:hypothetical protein